MANEKVTLEVLLETKRSVAQLERFTKQAVAQLGQVEKNTKSASSAFKRFGANLAANLASSAISKGFALLTSSLSNVATGFLDLSAAVAEINSILPKNQKLTEDTRKAFIRFSTEFGGKPAAQAKAFYQIVSAGITDTSKATDLLVTANKAAVAGVTDVTTVINGLTTVLANYESETFDANDAADVLFATVRDGKTNFGDLAATIGRAAPLAKAAGVSFQDLSGTVAFLTQTLPSTAEAITGIRGVLKTLIKPPQDAAKAAKEFGIDLQSIVETSGGFSQALQQIIAKTGGVTKSLGRIFTEAEAQVAIFAIAGDEAGKFGKTLDAVANSSGAAAEAFKEIEKTAAFQFGKLIRTIENLPQLLLTLSDQDFANLFAELRTTIVGLIPAFANFVLILTSFGKATSDITGFFGKLADKTYIYEQNIANLNEKLAKNKEATRRSSGDIRGLIKEKERLTKQLEIAKKGLAANTSASDAFGKSMETTGVAAANLANKTPGEIIKVSDLLNKSSVAAENLKKKLAEIVAKDTKILDFATSIGTTAALQAKVDEQLQILREAGETARGKELISLEEFEGQKAIIIQEGFEKQLKANGERQEALRKEGKKGDLVYLANQLKFIDQQLANTKAGTLQHQILTKKKADLEKQQFQLRARYANQFFGDISSLMQTKNKELFAIGKAAALAQAVVQGAVAVQNAWAVQPFPLGAALAAAAAIKTAVQISTISAQNLASGMTTVPKGFPNDTFRANLTSGERVVNVEQNRDLTGFLEEQRQNDGGLVGEKLDALIDGIGSLLAATENQDQTTVVNVGNREIIREIRTGLRAGNELAV